MKKFLFLKHFVLALTMMMIASFAMAQAPQGFNYQAFVRNSEGVVASQQVSVRISILSGSETGTEVYSETHTATTNAGGYFNITIGNGTAQNGTFADIQWGEGPLFLRSEVDPAGGSNYTIVSTQQLLSVPYALYAGNTDMTYFNRRLDSLSRVAANNSEALRRSKSDMAKGNDDCYATCGSVDTMAQLVQTLRHRIDSLKLAMAAINEGPAVVEIENGALPGAFSVSATKQVRFSQGNLQYQASSKAWRFAENQYDFVGADNSNISSTYTGWIDLFAWGTSGWKSGATYYQPYNTSTSTTGYKVGGKAQNDLTGNYNKADWGVYNAIINGGGQAGQWRTPAAAEWDYMIGGRTTQFVAAGTTYNIRYCRASVGGREGLILFPDNYTLPEGLNLPSETGGFADYRLSETQWTDMETAGAVFLPSAGYRNGTTMESSISGGYWSSTHYGDGTSYSLFFSSSSVKALSKFYRGRGFSVRLVQDLSISNPCAGKTSTTTFVQTACDSYEWHGNTYTTSTNEPTFTTTNVAGCDSTITLHLTINNSSATIDEQTACDFYEWHGYIISESTNEPTFTTTNIYGCDSTVTLHLTIGHTSTGIDNQTACDSYEWHGNTYTESTSTPTFTTTNVTGCDSTVTLHLTINYATSGIDEQESTTDYTWIDGNTYTESTETPTFTIAGGNAKGCDSTVTLHLTIVLTVSTETWVDLGLPSGTKWASRNVGANNPEEYGDYFAWGETETREQFTGQTIYTQPEWMGGGISKYNTDENLGTVDNKTTLEASDDAAAVNYGGRMPTQTDWEELLGYTTQRWATLNGVAGMLFTSNINGEKIFLPAAGGKNYAVNFAGEMGFYWSSELFMVPNDAYCMGIQYVEGYGGMANMQPSSRGQMGLSVRAVNND